MNNTSEESLVKSHFSFSSPKALFSMHRVLKLLRNNTKAVNTKFHDVIQVLRVGNNIYFFSIYGNLEET